MFRKFYCKECNEIKPRYGVKKEDDHYCYRYYCKYCHNQVISVDQLIIRMYKKLQKRTRLEELGDLHEWIKSEAKERYPDSKVGKAAFKAGIYALLDKIGFDYESGED